MPIRRGPGGRAFFFVLLLLAAIVGASCAGGGLTTRRYEYEEELYLALDGTATLNVNASVASLVALHGVDLPLNPDARLDRDRVRALYAGAGTLRAVNLSRRDGRRFVHVSIDVDDVTRISRIAPLAWSECRFDRQGDAFEYTELVGAPAGRDVGSVGWTGGELVAFRIHVPSRITFHNAPGGRVERGNILEWEQPLRDRLQGVPVRIQVQMESSSILQRTLLLFGSTIVAAAIAFALVIWWVARRGKAQETVDSRQ